MKNYALILASGTGKRFNSDLPKQFVKINGKTILEYSVDAFEQSNFIDEIIIIITPEFYSLAEKIIFDNKYNKVSKILPGGKERKDSSYIAVNAINEDEANVFIHDCARPFVSQDIIGRCAKALNLYNAVAAAIPASDTIIEVADDKIVSVPERRNIRRIQTPQCFRLSLIKKAHELSKNNSDFTDDCGLVLKYHLSDIHIVDGSERNIKITYPDDIKYAELILNK